MKKAIINIACASALSLASAQALSSEKVNIGAPSWTGAQAIAALLQAVVVERIGGEANLVPGNNATIFQPMDQGKGDIDVHPDVWLPNQQSFTNKYVDGNKSVTLGSNAYEGNQGFCVSEQFGSANNVTDIADLGRPDVASKMDSDGNGTIELAEMEQMKLGQSMFDRMDENEDGVISQEEFDAMKGKRDRKIKRQSHDE
mgnify:CR=1 FL=1